MLNTKCQCKVVVYLIKYLFTNNFFIMKYHFTVNLSIEYSDLNVKHQITVQSGCVLNQIPLHKQNFHDKNITSPLILILNTMIFMLRTPADADGFLRIYDRLFRFMLCLMLLVANFAKHTMMQNTLVLSSERAIQ